MEIRTQRKPGVPWPENFPRVLAMSSGPALLRHPDHIAAKSGDMDAAVRLVVALCKRDKIRELGEKYADAVVVPVHAHEESGGVNQIPAKYADYIGHLTGLEVDTETVQSSTVFRTGKGGWHRMAFRPEFSGKVQAGRPHILVDDFVTGGGSLSELRQYIHQNGGEVVAMSTIGFAQFSTNIALSEKTRLDLTTRNNEYLLHVWLNKHNLYGGEIGALTESEARLIYNAGSLDVAETRIFEAKQKAFERAQPELFPRTRAEEIISLSGRTPASQKQPLDGRSAGLSH